VGRENEGYIRWKEENPDGDTFHDRKIILPEGVEDYRVIVYIRNNGVVILDNVWIRELPDINVLEEGMVVADSNYQPFAMDTRFLRFPGWVGYGYTDQEVLDCIQLLAGAGVQWIRTEALWNGLEPSQDVISSTYLNRLDLVIDNALANGIEHCVKLGIQPQWVSEAPNEADYWYYAPTSFVEFEEYVEYLANRYKGRVTYWEIGNEIDWTFWKSDLSKYKQYLETAYTTLKAVDPNNQVIMGGLAFDGIRVWQFWDGKEEFALQKLYDAGVKDYFDIFAIHPYTHVLEDGTIKSIHEINTAYEIMLKNGDGDKRIWLTELGISSYGNDANMLEMQADYIETVYTELVKHPKVDKIFWYTLRTDEGSNEFTNNYGIVNYDLSIRPAYTRLVGLAKTSVRKVNYSFIPDELRVDFKTDREIGYLDLGLFSDNWLALDSNFPNWSNGADLNHDGAVDFFDFGFFADYWMESYRP